MKDIDEIIKRIESEQGELKEQVVSDEGMERLKQTALQYNGEFKLVWSHDVLEDVKSQPQRTNHLTGVTDFDDLTGGFREQQMIGVGAHSGHGKTAFGLWLLEKYPQLNPVLLPLEQSCEELVEQRDANGQFVPKYLSPKKHQSRVTADWVEDRIIEGIAKYNTKLVLIDHMGYLDAGSRYERSGEHVQIEKKLQDIKHLAIKWNVIVVILIQLTQMDESQTPSLKDLKGSSAIRQECDKVIFLWRKNHLKGKIRLYDDDVLLSLQKNRFNGRNGNIGLLFDVKTGDYKITESTSTWVQQMEETARQEVDADDMFDGI